MHIEALDVAVTIDGREVIGRESLVCRPGAMTALVGPSGCGKTTLLNCFGLLQRPSGGRITVDGVDTTGWGAGARRRFWRDHAAFVLQDYGIMEAESVAYNVTMSASLLRGRIHGDRERLRASLAQTGLAGREHETASHLSGGEKERLAVARAIYKGARVIFADEPTASLDEANRARVIELFTARAREGCTIIAATHDADVMAACDVRHTLGQLAAEAPAEAPTA